MRPWNTTTTRVSLLATFITATAIASTTSAAEIAGTVQSATAEYATVTADSDLMPSPGDKAEIFFKVPGADVDVSVASGHVYEITGANIMVKIDNASGTVAKSQLVRITSPNAKNKGDAAGATSVPVAPTAPPAAPPTAPPSTPVATQPPVTQEVPQASPKGPKNRSKPTPPRNEPANRSRQIIGLWLGTRHQTRYFPDGTFIIDPQLGPKSSRGHWSITGDQLTEYKSDGSAKSHRIISITSREFVFADEQGTHRKTRIGR
jgi:hypothetical protein